MFWIRIFLHLTDGPNKQLAKYIQTSIFNPGKKILASLSQIFWRSIHKYIYINGAYNIWCIYIGKMQ